MVVTILLGVWSIPAVNAANAAPAPSAALAPRSPVGPARTELATARETDELATREQQRSKSTERAIHTLLAIGAAALLPIGLCGLWFVAERDTWIGLVPVGYADGFRRNLTGTEVLVAGERRSVVGIVSMDSFAVELDRELPIGTPVVLLGGGVLAEDHARIAGTINYELVTGISSDPRRARRTVVDA